MVAVSRRLFTLEEYQRLTDLGFFDPEERVELIRGELIKMAAKRTPHSVCNSLLFKELVNIVDDAAIIRGQEPIIIHPNSAPEPDIVIARRKADYYLSSHPYPEDILLVIEVSESTLKYDREDKLSLYAEANLSNYWLFNLVANHLEVYTEPYQENQNKFNYRSKQIYLPNEQIAIPGLSGLSLDLSLIFDPLIGVL